MSTKYLSVVFTGEDKTASKTFKQVDDAAENTQTKLSKFGGAIGNAVKVGAIAGVAVGVAAIGKGVIAFADFERSMNEVFTLIPGTSKEAMDAMTKDVKNFSTEFGVLPDKVVPALYQALSAGVPKENVFKFLEVAQKAAKGGVTDLTVAVNGISSVMNAYGGDVLSATQASDLMFTAVRMGKTTFEEMSASLFQVTPTAAALGVKFGDVTAALASMTAQGVPTSVATTQLRGLFVELSKEGTKTSDVFSKISGKSFKEFIAVGGNTQQALSMLEKYAGKTNVGINDLFGSVEAGGAALALTGKGTETFTKNLAAMAESGGATDAAFEQMNTGLGPLIDKFKAFAAVFLIEIGTEVAPVIEKLVDFFEKNRVAAYALAGVVGGVLVAALGAYIISAGIAAAATIAAAAPFIAIGVAIAAMVAATIYLWNNWDQVWNWVMDHKAYAAIIAILGSVIIVPIVLLVATIKWLQANWETVWSKIQKAAQFAWSYIQPVWNAISTFVTGTLVPALILLGNKAVEIWNVIKNAIGFAWDNVIKPVFDFLVFYVSDVLIPIFQLLWNVVSPILSYIGEKIQRVWTDIIEPVWKLLSAYIINILVPYFQFLWDIVQVVFSAIGTVIGFVWNTMIKPAFDNIKYGIETVWQFFQIAKDVISTVFSGIADSISSPFREAFNFIARAWNNTVGKLSWTIPRIVPVFGGDTISAPRLSEFAKGGMVGDGPFMVGEQGPELGYKIGSSVRIFSNPDTKRIMGGGGMGGGTVNVYVTNAQASPYEIGKEVLWATKVAG